MTQRFILDENVFICAQLETDVYGESDSTCLELLQRILDICHPSSWTLKYTSGFTAN